jgi:hypothetical protein
MFVFIQKDNNDGMYPHVSSIEKRVVLVEYKKTVISSFINFSYLTSDNEANQY